MDDTAATKRDGKHLQTLNSQPRRALCGVLAIFALSTVSLGCNLSPAPQGSPAPQAVDFPSPIEGASRVYIDTRAVAEDLRLGRPVTLPFALADGRVVDKGVRLTLRNLRAPGLRTFGLKDGRRQTGRSMALPPPATYQGRVGERGSAALVITSQVVEGSLLDRDGWAIIEPLEPWLLAAGLEEAERAKILSEANHLVYHSTNAPAGSKGIDDTPGAETTGPASTSPARWPLTLRLAADGDREFYRAYPETSVMPFWLKQEGLFNALDWQYNCLEPDASQYNGFADCENEFDGGNGNFHLQVAVEALEVWIDGGPAAPDRETLIHQSIEMTHQSNPVCCGPPHTAGRAHHVHFFSGKDIAGLSAGIGSVNVYDERCNLPGGAVECHHAVSPMRLGTDFPGHVMAQQWIVAHEVGHNVGSHHGFGEFPCWLIPPQCGTNIMEVNFMSSLIFQYLDGSSKEIAAAVQRQIGGGTSSTEPAPALP